MKLKNTNFKGHLNILLLCVQGKRMSDLNMFHEKMSDFVSFPSFRFTLVIKLRNFDFESHRNTFMFFNKNDITSRFDYVLRKKIWFSFVSFPLLGFTLVIKLRNFDFESHWAFEFFFLLLFCFDHNNSVIGLKFVAVIFALFVFFGITIEIVSN